MFYITVWIPFDFLYIKYLCFLHNGKHDEEVTVTDIFPVELVHDDNGTGGPDTLDGVEIMVISISTIYTYIFTLQKFIFLFFNNYFNIIYFNINSTQYYT